MYPSAFLLSTILLLTTRISFRVRCVQCVRYAVFRASGVSATQARKQFGFEKMLERSKRVEACIDHAQYIRKSIDQLAMSKERSVLLSLGINPDPSDSSDVESTDVSTDEDDYSSGFDRSQSQLQACSRDCQISLAQLSEIVKQSECNWFEVVARVEASVGLDNSDVMTQLSSSIYGILTFKNRSFLTFTLALNFSHTRAKLATHTR